MPTQTASPRVPRVSAFDAIQPEAAGMPLFRAVRLSLLRAIEAGSNERRTARNSGMPAASGWMASKAETRGTRGLAVWVGIQPF